MNEELVFNPTRLDMSRSVFPVKRYDKGTGFVGRLNVLRPFEVLPASSWDLDLNSLIRFTTPIFPVNDDLICDVMFYYTSNDMLLRRQSFSPSLNDGNHSFAAVMGAQDGFINMPFPDNGLKLPVIKYHMVRYKSSDGSMENKARLHVLANSLLDQLGYPLCIRDSSVSSVTFPIVSDFNCLPLLGYLSIWNEDFREPNCMNRYAMTINNGVSTFSSDLVTMCLGTSTMPGDGGTAYGSSGKPINYHVSPMDTATLNYVIPLPVCRFHGLYGSLLPFPQRNSEAVTLPLGELAPVYARGDGDENNPKPADGWSPLVLGQINSSNLVFSDGNLEMGDDGVAMSDGQGSGSLGSQPLGVTPANLVADLSNATAASINTIRAAFQTQKWYEALARGGNSDLDEYINSLFGVVGPTDVVAKRPVYLGGKRFPISISQVNNTASNVGETGAFSLTNDVAPRIVKFHSKTYGMIYCVFCIRFADSYADAPQKFLFKREKFDFYFPQFANLGEEAYRRFMLAYAPTSLISNAGLTLGYQEYGADNRYDFNAISGQLRFTGENSWNFANLFEAGKMDLLSWLDASYQALAVDRTLKVPGSTGFYHFFYDFLITGKKYLPMPVNSIPGLVDHH